jgi:hypothetical protein
MQFGFEKLDDEHFYHMLFIRSAKKRKKACLVVKSGVILKKNTFSPFLFFHVWMMRFWGKI